MSDLWLRLGILKTSFSSALTFVDLERDSEVSEQVHTALIAYSVRLAHKLDFVTFVISQLIN